MGEYRNGEKGAQADDSRLDLRSRRFDGAWRLGRCALTKVNDQDAIRASIEKHLNGRADLNLSVMDREVKQVSVNGDHASAQVEFRLKGGDARMEIEYALERQGKEWAVLSSQPMGMGDAFHREIESPKPRPPDNKTRR